MAIDDADGSEAPELEGAVDAESPDRDGTDVRVGQYTWADFLEEYGTEGDAEALYRDVPTASEGTESARWDDGETGPRRPGAADWERVDLDPVPFLGFHPTAVEDAVGDVGGRAERLQAVFEEFCDPETTPVVKDEWLWEHYKREYYYEDDGSRPRDEDGEVERFDEREALGFDPERIEDVLAHGAQRARETDDLVDERTVDIAEGFDEESFFTDEDGLTTIANRYDLEKTVPLEKKSHFREVERYWVNKPYSFVVIFHSVKENEKKYYLVQPHLNRIEAELTEFLEGKLRTAIKYADETVAVEGEENRGRVIEEQTYELLERYNLYDPPVDGDEGGLLAALAALFEPEDGDDDGPSAFARLLARLGLAGQSGEREPSSAAADSSAAAAAEESAPTVVGTEPEAAADPGSAESAPTADAAGELGAGDVPELPGGDAGASGDLPATADADLATTDDADAAGADGAPALEGEVDPSATDSEPDATDSDAGGDGDEAQPADAPAADATPGAASAEADGLVGRLLARLRGLLGSPDDVVEDGGPGIEGIAARPEPAVLAEDRDDLTEYQVVKLLYYLKRDFIGYERIDGIKHDINVEDISCDGYNSPVFVYHSDYEQIITNVYHGTEELDDFVVKLAQRSGKGISKRRPQVDATLPDGSRAQLTLGKEVSDHGTNYTIRQFKDVPFTPIDLINWNTFSLDQMAFLWLCIENNKSLIFAGGTASGKTTSLNAVSLFIPSNSKIVSIEDTREVELPQRNWIASVTRPSFADDDTGDIDEFDLLEAALRQRPEYIVMGEIRGEEGRTLFQVMSTGHTTYTTFHADSVGEVLKRFTTDPINVSKTMFTALDLVSIQTSTRVEGDKVRRNKSLTEINHYDPENDEINVQDVYQWQAETDEFLKMGASNTLEEIKFDRGWSHDTLEHEIFKRQVVLAYLIDRGLNTYTQVAATFQAFINDQETILTLMANDQLERSLEDLREMESVLIDIDPEKEEMVPRPDANDAVGRQAAEILERAEAELFDDYRGEEAGSVADALLDVPERPDVTPTRDGADHPELDAVAENAALDEADRSALDEADRSALDDADPSPLDAGEGADPAPGGASDDASSGGAANADGGAAGDGAAADEDPTPGETGTASGGDPFGRSSTGAADTDLGDVFSPDGDDPWLEDDEEGTPADADAGGADSATDDDGTADGPSTDPADSSDSPTDESATFDLSAEADDSTSEEATATEPASSDAGGDPEPDEGAVSDDGAPDAGSTAAERSTANEASSTDDAEGDAATLDDDAEGDAATLDDDWAFGEFEDPSSSDAGEDDE